MILTLHAFWSAHGCLILQPYDMRMGAGTFHTATTLRALGPGAVERRLRPALPPPDRRPLWREPQPAAALLPVPGDPEAEPGRTCRSSTSTASRSIGIDPLKHDIRFVEDDWESPTLGAWGLGWEVWCDGMEVTQFTYFQQMGGFDCKPVAGELTYGLERLAMYIQGVDNVYDLDFDGRGTSYGEVFLENEKQMSKWNFEVADTDALFDLFAKAEAECRNALAARCPDRRLRAGDRGEPRVQPAAGARRDQRAGTRQLHGPRARSRARRCEAYMAKEADRWAKRISGVGGVSAADFLLELRCEEIPARMQAGARAELEKLFREQHGRGRVSPWRRSPCGPPRAAWR